MKVVPPSLQRILLLTISILLLVSSCTKKQHDEPSKANEITFVQPVIFGEDVISTELPEFATSFSPDGNTVYFNVANAERSVLQIMFATRIDGVWSKPEALPFSDGTFFDVDPFVSHDGSRLYFSSNRPLARDTAKDFDTWYVEKREDGWSDPINLGAPLNGEESEVFFSMTRDGTAYFSISTDGIRKIYRSAYSEGVYREPEQIRLDVADSVSVGNPLIDPNERFILFTSDMLGGMGNADIYIADKREEGSFGNVRNLGAQVNSVYSDFAPGLGPDGRYLYFTSERPGIVGPMEEGRPPGDLYKVSLESVFSSLRR